MKARRLAKAITRARGFDLDLGDAIYFNSMERKSNKKLWFSVEEAAKRR